MRGIIKFLRGVSFGVKEFGWSETVAHMRAEWRGALNDHAAIYYHPEGLSSGTVIYLRLPFTRLSAMLEWSGVSLWRGVERSAEGWDWYAGRLKASLFREQGELYSSARSVM